jgi:hypothetical protein
MAAFLCDLWISAVSICPILSLYPERLYDSLWKFLQVLKIDPLCSWELYRGNSLANCTGNLVHIDFVVLLLRDEIQLKVGEGGCSSPLSHLKMSRYRRVTIADNLIGIV